MTMTYDGTNGITFPDSSLQKTAGYSPFRNRIINGDMRIDQRNSGVAITATGFPVDRWNFYKDTVGASVSVQRSTTAPSGFVNSISLTVSTGATPASGEGNSFMQPIEGLNVSDLGWGTASASTVALSFWVRSSLTGTFGGSITNSANNRSYPFTYTISAVNTFEYKTITIPGDTTGTWLTTNGVGIRVWLGLGTGSTLSGTAGSWSGNTYISATGSTSVVGTSGATFYITGVQLEKGSVATPFEYRPYGQELALCQRYYQTSGNGGNPANQTGGFTGTTVVANTSIAQGPTPFKVTMRTTPTITLFDGVGASGCVTQTGIVDGIVAVANLVNSNGFNQVQRSSGSFTTTAGYPVNAGYNATAEL